MKIGMLWFDESREADIAQRIRRASEYYTSKYGQEPDLCFVHPDAIEGDEQVGDETLKIKSSQTLLKDYFWIGVEERPE